MNLKSYIGIYIKSMKAYEKNLMLNLKSYISIYI